MNKHSVVVGSLLLIAPGILMAREPKLHNPCKNLQNDLDSQVNNLHRQQNDELAQCRQTNGKNADVCRDLKNQQQLALRQLRDQRQSELSRCNPRLNGSSVQSGRTESCDSAAYQNQDNDRYHHKKHPDSPYPPTTNPPNVQNPPKHDGTGNGHRGDPDAGPTRNAGGSGSSQRGADHSSGSSSSSSGGGSGSSSHSGSSSSSGSGSSGSSSNNSSSSSSNSSSNSSNSSSSGSNYSPPASSAPAPSSAPSHSSGGRPPR